jgi:hemolysin III
MRQLLCVPEGERANAATNGIGLVMSVVGGLALMAKALGDTGAGVDAWRALGCGVFAVTFVALYAASTLSHGVVSPGPRRLFRVLDQALIYVFIAGSFTPFAFAYLRSPPWFAFLALMWGLAAWGLVSKLAWNRKVDAVTVRSHIAMGWLTLIPFLAMLRVAPAGMLAWVLAGGLSYTLGAVFFVLDDRRFHCHAIWHSFALLGSLCHLAGVYWYVA